MNKALVALAPSQPVLDDVDHHFGDDSMQQIIESYKKHMRNQAKSMENVGKK